MSFARGGFTFRARREERGLQHPCQPAVQLGVHALKIRQCDFLLQYHFMERNDKVSVKESSVEDAQA